MAKLDLTHQLGNWPPSAHCFGPVAHRWVVERTFTWLTSFRRIAIDLDPAPP